jgi:hypothetical protein
MSEQRPTDLRPWRLTPIADALLISWIIFVGAIALMMVHLASGTDMTIVSRGLVAGLGLSAVGGGVSGFFLIRAARHSPWPELESDAEHPDVRRVLVWKRRSRLFWILGLVCVFGIPLVESAAGHGHWYWEAVQK